MIIFLKNHPQKNEVIKSTDCITPGINYTRTVNASGSKLIYSDVFTKQERRYWVTMTDNDTGEIITCEYALTI